MPQSDRKPVSRDQYDAILFDLDGVVTDTASVCATPSSLRLVIACLPCTAFVQSTRSRFSPSVHTRAGIQGR